MRSSAAFAPTPGPTCFSEYGVGFRRIHAWGPAFYAVGLGVGVKAPDELNQVINFRETTWAKHYLKGHLGGIFPWNFLTAPQLQASVNGTSLETWIQAAPHRGSLEPFTSKMSLWSVPEEDIPSVCKDLWEANVVFDYERYCNARWEQSKAAAKPESAEEVLGNVLKAYGYESPAEAQILKIEKLGEVRELSEDEAKEIITNRKNPPKR